jgi:tRNA nucleotidyltransferase (CCA-adding enzyme)
MKNMDKTKKIPSFLVPDEVLNVARGLKKANFEAFLVGGCVRDILLEKEPKDWDIATNAKPEEVQSIFPHTFYENTFGTVGVVNDKASKESLKTVEVTTYRLEGEYSDSRRPDEVVFSKKIEDDLKRRDFTINAMAIVLDPDIKDISKGQLVDPFDGYADIKDRVIRTVLDPEKRFNEDALRIMRAVRLSTVLDFMIETSTRKSIEMLHMKLSFISKERIRDEFVKIIMSKNPEYGLTAIRELGLMKYVIPELESGVGIEQGGIHSYDVFEHSVKTLQAAADKGLQLEVRLASLLHDIGKPQTRKGGGKNKEWSFYNHEVVGARMSKKILSDLKFPKDIIGKVYNLVRWHMFFSDTEQITHSAVRRIIRNVGPENIWDLIDLRITDRLGTGRPKEEPYRLRKYKAMIEEVLRDPISVQMLEIDGSKVMEVTRVTPGPKIGYILHALLEEVLEDPKLNSKEYLEKRAIEFSKMDDYKLIEIGEKGKLKAKEEDKEEVKKIRDKNWVK